MGHTNSSLVSYTKLSPNHSGQRTHSIDRITPHCVVGQLSAESICGCFISTDSQASCNYGIGTDGRVSLCVEEKNRSWCTSSRENDQRAITIECASDKTDPYAMNSKVYSSLINLCVDICRRNGKKKLLWFADKNKTMTYEPKSDEMILSVHRWFANKSCPGDWLYSRLGDLANKVTSALGGTAETPSQTTSNEETIWNFFKGKGLNDFAIAGIMGNLFAESSLNPKNLQNSYEKSLGFTDDSYTKAVDDGSYGNFVKDSAGYGLAQWTYYSRKQALLDYAKSVGKSIGDLGMQSEFMWKELQGYTSVVNTLKSATSVLEASNAILLQYERPADQSESVQKKRADCGQKYFNKFAGKPATPETSNEVLYKVRKSWADAKSQLGAYKVLTNAKKTADKNPGYYVFDEKGNAIYPEKTSAPATKKVAYAQSKDKSLAGSYRVTANSGLNLRYEPGKLDDAYIILTIPVNAVVHNYGYYTTVNGVKWLYVEYRGQVGFVHSSYLRKV